jgi:hypothetical protein
MHTSNLTRTNHYHSHAHLSVAIADLSSALHSSGFDAEIEFIAYYAIDLEDTHDRAIWTVTERVPQGARICAEAPLVHFPSNSTQNNIFTVVHSLSLGEWTAYMALDANVTHEDRERAAADHSHNWPVLDTYQQDVLAIRQYGQMDRVVCRHSGAVEMSWTPNCAGNWNAAAGMFTIHALQDIPANTPLSMSHGDWDL